MNSIVLLRSHMACLTTRMVILGWPDSVISWWPGTDWAHITQGGCRCCTVQWRHCKKVIAEENAWRLKNGSFILALVVVQYIRRTQMIELLTDGFAWLCCPHCIYKKVQTEDSLVFKSKIIQPFLILISNVIVNNCFDLFKVSVSLYGTVPALL